MSIRRLTRVEYNNTVYQLFGDTSNPANAFPPDEEAGGVDNQAEVLVVSPLLAEGYLKRILEMRMQCFVTTTNSASIAELDDDASESINVVDVRNGAIISTQPATFRWKGAA